MTAVILINKIFVSALLVLSINSWAQPRISFKQKDISTKIQEHPIEEVGKEIEDSNSSSDIFVDITDRSGIDFVHFNGTTGNYMLPEITGSGGALFDYDNDGDLDLYVVQGALLITNTNPSAVSWHGKTPPRDRLFRNDLGTNGKIHFRDVTEDSGINALGYGMGVATGDFNNDGWMDVYVTNLGSNQLWRNNGNGTFTDVAKESGSDDPRWSTSATFFDFDNDGWMDLFITHYVDFSVNMKRECFSLTSAPDYCGPSSYDPVEDKLFRNLGDGTFEDMTVSSGIGNLKGPGLGVVAADFDNDGWTDIFVANDGAFNRLWKNKKGTGFFEDIAPLAGVAVNRMGQPEASMGVTVEDFDHDGDVDLFMTHLERESNTFYVNHGDGLFEDRTIQMGLHVPSLRYTSFGTKLFDYDNDGWLDLIVLNGAVRNIPELAREGDPYPLHQRNQLFQNDGNFGFVETTEKTGPAFELSEVSRGASLGDIDNDGDTDVVIFNNNGRTRLLLNQVGNQHHWIGFQLLQKNSRLNTYQARIEVLDSNGNVLWRRAHTDGSYCSAGSPRILIGLGHSTKIKTVRVHWTEGHIEQFDDLPIDRYWVLEQGSTAIEFEEKK